MPTPAIVYAIVTIGLISICLFLIYTMLVHKLVLNNSIVVLDYYVRIDRYAVLKVSSNTSVYVKEKPNSCTIIKPSSDTVYVICDCRYMNNTTLVICGGKFCKAFFVWCK